MLLAYVKINHILQQCSQDVFDLLLIPYTLAAADPLPEGIVMMQLAPLLRWPST